MRKSHLDLWETGWNLLGLSWPTKRSKLQRTIHAWRKLGQRVCQDSIYTASRSRWIQSLRVLDNWFWPGNHNIGWTKEVYVLCISCIWWTCVTIYSFLPILSLVLILSHLINRHLDWCLTSNRITSCSPLTLCMFLLFSLTKHLYLDPHF